MKLRYLILASSVVVGLSSCGDDGGGPVNVGAGGPSNPDSCAGSALADHILITEVAVTPTQAEYVEIYNPTGQQIVLDDYYLYNSTSPSAPVCRYYNAANPGTCASDGTTDFILRFPSGATINPGQYQVIAVTTAGGYCNTYYSGGQCVFPDYESTYPGHDSPPVINMRGVYDTTNDAFVRFGFLEAASEEIILFKWDGVSTRVTDIDYVVWGTNLDFRTDKTGVGTYKPDTPIGAQKTMPGNIPSRMTYQRICLGEIGERRAGGNGITGHDETSEDLTKSFVVADPTPGKPTVGVGP